VPGRSNPLDAHRRARALELLAEVSGRPVQILTEEPLGSDWAPVTRLRLDRPIRDVGDTVIVKTRRVVLADWGKGRHVEHELAGLRAVASLDLAPRVVASDEHVGVIIMCELAGQTLETVLLDDDPDAATAAFLGYAETLGRLHAATAHHRPPDDAERYGPWPGADAWPQIVEASAALDFPDASVAVPDVDELCAVLRDPGPFLALNHADPTPGNAIVTPDGVRFVDFEGCGFRHTACDAANLRFPFHNYSAHWALIPADVVAAADAVYRSALVARIREAEDDAVYRRAIAFGCAAELAVRTQRLRLLASEGQTPHDQWRRRAQLVQQIDVFVPLATDARVLPRLAGWFASLVSAMRSRWEDASEPPPPWFPAFVTYG
jgi:hypothetical protein